jgi:C4-dicarboxylate transporter DctM subunit
MALLGLAGLLLLLLVLRQPILVLLIVGVSYAYLASGDTALHFMVLDAWDALNREILLSIPLYLLAGNLMSRGSMASRITDLMAALTHRVPGGLALSAVLACALFAAMTGSSTVTLLAVGSVLFPALLAAGYGRSLAIGVLCAGGTLGIIIPPSIPLILYGVMTNTSIVDLFYAGLGPALVLVSLMAAYVLWRCRGIRGRDPRPGRRAALRNSAGALLAPVLVLGGIYSGYFTATEAAAVAVAYTLLLQVGIYREMSWREVGDVFFDTGKLVGSLFPVLMLAVCLNMFLTLQQLPEQWVGQVIERVDSPAAFLLASNLVLLVTGSLVDVGSAILILAPLLQPVARELGIDAVHFGIMMIVNLEIGYLTPPMGLNLIVAMGAFKAGFGEVCRAALPFIGLMLLGLVLVALVPQISLFLIAL